MLNPGFYFEAAFVALSAAFSALFVGLLSKAIFFLRALRTYLRRRVQEGPPPPGLFLGRIMPILSSLGPHLARFLPAPYASYLDSLLFSSGMSAWLDCERVAAYQIVMGLFLFGVMFLFFGPSIISLVGFLVGFGFPIVWLRSARDGRRRKVSRELPYVLDILAISVSSGLDIIPAMSRVASLKEGMFASEFSRVLGDIRLGSGRKEAFDALRRRLAHPDVDVFVGLILGADALGAAIAPILTSYARKMRRIKFEEAERRGRLAGEKALLPLILCILPAVFIVILGPLFVMWIDGTFQRLVGY